MKKIFVNITIFFLMISQISVLSQDVAIPINIQIPLFFKILSYDRTFKSKYNSQLVITIIYQKKFRNSLTVKNDISQFFQDNQQYQIFGSIPVSIKSIAIENENDLKTYMIGHHQECYYICPLRAVDIKSIAKLAIDNKVLTFTGVPEYTNDGITIGFGTKGDKPLIIINLESAKRIGADYSSQLLKLSKVIE